MYILTFLSCYINIKVSIKGDKDALKYITYLVIMPTADPIKNLMYVKNFPNS